MDSIPPPPAPRPDPKQQAEQPIFKMPQGGKMGDRNAAMKEVGPYLTLGFQLAMFVVIGVAIGWYLDKDTGSTLWTGLFAALGAVFGMIYFLRAVMRLGKKKSPGPTKKP
jgi:F0F1-type ATP synthase assembly protein I